MGVLMADEAASDGQVQADGLEDGLLDRSSERPGNLPA